MLSMKKETKKVARGITMTESTDKALKAICQLTGLSIASAIAMCVNAYYVERLEDLRRLGIVKDKE